MNLKLILVLVLMGLAAIFIIQNVTVVDVRFLFWNVSMSRALLIFFLLIIGIALGWVFHSYFSFWKSKDESGRNVRVSILLNGIFSRFIFLIFVVVNTPKYSLFFDT